MAFPGVSNAVSASSSGLGFAVPSTGISRAHYEVASKPVSARVVLEAGQSIPAQNGWSSALKFGLGIGASVAAFKSTGGMFGHSGHGSKSRRVRSLDAVRGVHAGEGKSNRRSPAALWLLGLAVMSVVCVFFPFQAAQAATQSAPGFGAVVTMAARSAFKGGLAGLLAGVFQVMAFMWLRTTMNYQYYNGGTMRSALNNLLAEGGVARLYQGLSFAVVQAPLSRFGDTAANAGVFALLNVYFPNLPVPTKTAFASTAAAMWRIFLTPIDTLKTARQVQGKQAMKVVMDRVRQGGIGELYAGASANFVANWIGNYPYFVVFNTLSHLVPIPAHPALRIVRFGVIGMCGTMTSDTVSNSLRVLKTVRQSMADPSMGYMGVAREIIRKDGLWGLFGRGLETRLLVNLMQGTLFTIVWRLVQDRMGH